jgi:hypothetical protein
MENDEWKIFFQKLKLLTLLAQESLDGALSAPSFCP